ncbi:MAG: hypothetical protein M1816_003972 [Peltula sp. TS41687]|nr:MAG: hypothetical protein M1816_003972 [Peltula sp. TS41687]
MASEDKDDGETVEDLVTPIKVEETGPYFLRTLIDNVDLSADGNDLEVSITCVELLKGNLYIGTSRGELLHYVLVPLETAEADSRPSYILASRSQPPSGTTPSGAYHDVGIQQILLLPRASKACILCNGTLTFYSLPELSPAFAATQVKNCNWVGGIDLSFEKDTHDELIMISLKSRIRLIELGEKPRPVVIRNIEYASSLTTLRRGSFACVANEHSYALLDVEHQRKIPLFPISSLEGTSTGNLAGEAEGTRSNVAIRGHPNESSLRTGSPGAMGDLRAHGRSTSLGVLVGSFGRREQSPRPRSQDQHTQSPREVLPGELPSRPTTSQDGQHPGGDASHPANLSSDKPLPPPPANTQGQTETNSSQTAPTVSSTALRPHILSPTPDEFLLTTGTTNSEPGVGIFVNMDGDVCRSTINFERYPVDLVLDSEETDTNSHDQGSAAVSQAYVLAVVEESDHREGAIGIEIQRLDGEVEEIWGQKAWLPVAPAKGDLSEGQSIEGRVGVRKVLTACEISSKELRMALQLVRLDLPSHRSIGFQQTLADEKGVVAQEQQEKPPKDKIVQASNQEKALEHIDADLSESRDMPRLREEEQFARRFSMQRSQLIVWAGNEVWSIVRNPLALRLEAMLDMAITQSAGEDLVDRQKVIGLLDSIRGQEPRTETQFLSLGYIRQKASLLLFINMIASSSKGVSLSGDEERLTEESLLEGAIDPRVIMAMVPLLQQDIVEGQGGIWVHGGVRSYIQHHICSGDVLMRSQNGSEEPKEDLLHILRRYLSAWRRKKGFGSIADEKEVFESVDGGLLHVLLQLDGKNGHKGNGVRPELYSVVRTGVDCFDRAVVLLEQYRRLYVLSLLYHGRKMSRNVLATWKRILEGDASEGDEFVDGENVMRDYLAKIKDVGLVQEYGTWLARRQPSLGVLVFTDERSKVRLEPAKVIEILKSGAPDALREYLEHLVLNKNVSEYANELISCYLDSLLPVLQSSERARSILSQSYETYRALRPPRPTYREFITDNAVDERWWQDRIRLLQLLGGTQGAAVSRYDVPLALGRIEPFEKELVPEMIILDGKQARHQPALRLLIHGLGDYDSAINYCLLGGSGLFHPTFGSSTPSEVLPTPDDEHASTLFGYLLAEFLRIQDADEQVEQTGALLERFGRWYDIQQVLSEIPDSWSIELVSEFIINSLRRLLAERNETLVAKALSGADNLQINARLIDESEKIGPAIEGVMD